jgi:predicted MPP superfamily phosphohydrolase
VRQFNVADRFHGILEQHGFQVLRNRSTDIGGLRIFGVDDLWSQQFDLPATLKGVDANAPSLALCHNPDGADIEAWEDFQGWILAGHTHGGQCKLPGMTAPLLPVKNKKYAAGKIVLSDSRTLYVNRGLGYLRRVRFCARPEITVFTLRTM